MIRYLGIPSLCLVLITGCVNANSSAENPHQQIVESSKNTPQTDGPSDYEYKNVDGGTPQEQAEEVLSSWFHGRMIVAGNYPHSVVTNYLWQDNRVYFPLAKKDYTDILKIIEKNSKVCFAVDKYNPRVWHSVHIFGEAKIINASKKVNSLLDTYKKTVGNTGFTYSADVSDMVWVEISPKLITARCNYGIPFWYLGKLKPDKEKQKLIPIVPAPKETESTAFAADVKFKGGSAVLADYILRQSHSGRINTLGKDGPYSVPVNCGYARGKMVIHSNKNGLKVLNIKENPNVSFDVEWFWDGETWYAVTIEGKAKLLPPAEGIEAMQYFERFLQSPDGRIPDDFQPEKKESIGRPEMMARMQVLEVTPELVITRRITIPKEWHTKMPEALDTGEEE